MEYRKIKAVLEELVSRDTTSYVDFEFEGGKTINFARGEDDTVYLQIFSSPLSLKEQQQLQPYLQRYGVPYDKKSLNAFEAGIKKEHVAHKGALLVSSLIQVYPDIFSPVKNIERGWSDFYLGEAKGFGQSPLANQCEPILKEVAESLALIPVTWSQQVAMHMGMATALIKVLGGSKDEARELLQACLDHTDEQFERVQKDVRETSADLN